MLNPLKNKIADIKFSVKHLESECDLQGYPEAQHLLERAREMIDEAILSTEISMQFSKRDIE